MNRRHSSLILGLTLGSILSVVFIAGFVAGAVVGRPGSNSADSSSDPNVRDFVSAYRLVTQHSFYRPFDKQHLVYAAIDGMLAATGDPHTIFLSPRDNQVAVQQLNGTDFGGIGAIVVPVHSALEVVVPLPSSPAAQAGVRAGDIVTRIDGKLVSRMGGNAAVAHIHGRPGTHVRLTVIRAGHPPFVVSVARSKIPAVTAYGRVLPHRLGYIQILSFGNTTTREVEQAVAMLNSKKVRGIVLDLRENPGGFVDAAQGVVSQFVKSGVIAYEKTTNNQLDPLPVLGGHRRVTVPVVILVDGGTASAAEITAAALHDDAHAVILGTQTYGKGSMQSVYTLSDGSSVRITDRLWLTPRKQSIQSVGIRPDRIVRGSSQPGSLDDPQLHAAEVYLEHHVRP